MQTKHKPISLFFLLSLLVIGFSGSVKGQTDDEEFRKFYFTYPKLYPRIEYGVDTSGHKNFTLDPKVKLKFKDVCASLEYCIGANMNNAQSQDLNVFRIPNRLETLSKKECYKKSSPYLYLAYLEWKSEAQLRQGADGSFVNGADRMWNEIQRLNAIDQQKKASREAGEQQSDCFGGTWTNIGPFFNHTIDDATAENHASTTPGIGRVAVLRKHPIQDVLYLGGATGGLWKSVPNGAAEPIGHRWQVVGNGAGDIFPTMGIADIAFNNIGNTMYVATGDRTRGLRELGQTSYSMGVLKSTDNGTTWQPLSNNVTWRRLAIGTTNNTHHLVNPKYLKINRLLVNANGDLFIAANILVDVLEGIVGTTTNPANYNIYGVWKFNTTNNSWDQLVHFNNEVCSMEFGNTTQTAIVATSLNTEIKRTTDNGITWTTISIPQSSTTSKHVSLSNVVQSGSDNVMYLMSSAPFFLLKSIDGGASFNLINLAILGPNHNDISSFEILPTGPRSVVTINPSNVNELYLGAAGNTDPAQGNGGKLVFKVVMNGNNVVSTTAVAFSPQTASLAGGNINKYMHTDLNNFLWIGNKLFIAHDGGLSYTADGGATWSKWYETTRDLCITEALSVSNTKSSNYQCVYTSSWDNGCYRAKRNGSSGTFEWYNFMEGDGLQIAINQEATTQNSIGYLFSNAGIHKYRPSNPATTTVSDIVSDAITSGQLEMGSDFEGRFLPDIKLKKVTVSGTANTLSVPGIISGFARLARVKSPYSISSPPFESFSMGTSCVGCDYIATTPGQTGFTQFPWSAVDMVGNKVYAGRKQVMIDVSENILAFSNDSGVSWTRKNGANLPGGVGKILTDLIINPQNDQMLFATYSGFDNFESDIETVAFNANNTVASGKVLMSVNGGDTWTDITAGKIIPGDLYGNPEPTLPKNMLPDLPVLCATLHATDATTWHLFIGTDVGVYYTNNSLRSCLGGPQWMPFSGGLPRAAVQELEVFTDGGTSVLRAATLGRGIWETPLTNIGGTNCSCAVCGDDAYPLIAHIAAAPDHVVTHPEAYLAPDWANNISSNTDIRMVNGSSSTFNNNACTWSFDDGFVQASYTDCAGTPIANLENYHGDCLIATWTNDFSAAQTVTATLQVTDITNCTATTTTNFIVHPFDSDCEINNSVDYEILPSHEICGDNGLCKTLLPTGTGTGSIKIKPNIFAGSGEFQYILKKLNTAGEIVNIFQDNNVRAIWQPNGNLSFECLEPANYRLNVIDQATACTDEINNLNISNEGTMIMALSDEVKNSYRLCVAEAGTSPDKRTGKISITAINGTPIEQLYNDYIFVWSDCATCSQPSRENLAKGTYTVTVTHRPTGCTTTKTYEIVFNNIQVVSGGIVVDNGSVSINDPEPTLKIDAPAIFDDQAQVRLELPQDMYITLKVYNTNGVMVKEILNNELKTKGIHYYMHNATNLPNGLYTYVAKGCEEQKTDSGFKY